jgi:hypothetical protein
MTADQLILDALRITPMTGSEIGKGFAPEHIKDRAGWGRKWLARNAEAVAALAESAPVETGIDFTRLPLDDTFGVLKRAQVVIAYWAELAFNGRGSYKHILAPRGTLPRPHHPRHTRRFRFCNN